MSEHLTGLLYSLEKAGLYLDPEGARDALWLALHVAGPLIQPLRSDPQAQPGAQAVDRDPDDAALEKETIPTLAEGESLSEPGMVGDDVEGGRGALQPVTARRVHLPVVSALPGSRELMRSMRPLRRKAVSSVSRFVDEEATIRRAVEEDIWLPVFKPAPEHWLDLALVIDSSLSMIVWDAMVKELRQALRGSGAFRSIQLWWLDTEGEKLLLYARDPRRSQGPGARRLREVAGGGNRTLVTLLTDCVSHGWYNGNITRTLYDWSRNAPVALLQVLPERMWSRTALGDAERVKLRASTAAATNAHLSSITELPWPEFGTDDGTRELRLPVVPLEPQSLNLLARMVAGTSSHWTPGVTIYLDEDALPDMLPISSPAIKPTECVERFWNLASSLAIRLASILAASPALNMDLLHIIRRELLPEAHLVHEAEVILGGLLKVHTPESGAGRENQAYELEFVKGVRSYLLNNATAKEVLAVLNKVAEHQEIPGINREFIEMLVADPASVSESIDPAAEPASENLSLVLERLGGDYARAVRRTSQTDAERHVSVDKGGRPESKIEAMKMVLTVAQDGTGDFRSIAEAVSAATPGARITVRRGVYYENVELKEEMELIGEDVDSVVIDGQGNGWVVNATDGCTIRGLTIQNSGKETGVDDCGVRVTDCQECTVAANRIIRNGHYGIILRNCRARIVENLIASNEILGIYIDSGAIFEISGNIIADHRHSAVNLNYNDSKGIIRNNNLLNAEHGIMYGDELKKPLQLSIVNNIFSKNESAIFAPYPFADEIGFNLYFANKRNWYDWDKKETVVLEAPNIFEDPLFAVAESGDYRLSPGSPARGVGKDGVDVGAIGFKDITDSTDDGTQSQVSPEVPADQREATVTANKLNLRQEPSVKSSVIGWLSSGETVTVLSDKEEWCLVRTVDGRQGYAMGRYLQSPVEKPADDLVIREVSEGGQPRIYVSLAGKQARFTRFKKGVYTVGRQKPIDFINNNRSSLSDLGLTDSAINVMAAVSEIEGNLDALNTWDNAFLSFGLFQWGCGTGSDPGELPALLSKIKSANEVVFQNYFGRYGLDTVDTNEISGFFSLDGQLLANRSQKEKLRAVEGAFYFWLAGQDQAVQAIEIQHALERINMFYRSDSHRVKGKLIADLVTSEYGVGLLLDHHVNRPGYLKACLIKAMDQTGLVNPNNWGTPAERKLINAYLNIRESHGRYPMTDAKKRAATIKNYLDDGIISDERGSFQYNHEPIPQKKDKQHKYSE